MDKRFVTFLLFSMLVMVGYLQLRLWLNPPPDPDEVVQADQVVENIDKDEIAGNPDEADDPADSDSSDVEDEAADNVPAEDAEADRTRKKQPPRWITLGSIDPASKYRMLVTFSTRGGTIQRAELSAKRYHDLESEAGYLGQLALTETAGGLKVNAVGEGTPASLAKAASDAETGLKVGDVITQLNETTLEDTAAHSLASHFNELVAQTKPGDSLELHLRREVDGEERVFIYTAKLSVPPLEVLSAELDDITDPTSGLQPFSFATTVSEVGSRSMKSAVDVYSREEIDGLPSLHEEHWEYLDPSDAELKEKYNLATSDEVAFRFELAPGDLKAINEQGQLEIIKRFRLVQVDSPDGEEDASSGYHLTMNLEVRNLGEETKRVGLQQMGPTGLPLEGWWYQRKQSPHWGSAGMRDIVWRAVEKPNKIYRNAVITHNQEDEQIPTTLFNEPEQMRYCGGDGLYFGAALLPDKDAKSYSPEKFIYVYGEAFPTGKVLEGRREPSTGVSFRLVNQPVDIPAGESYQQQYTVFVGPKDPEVLERYGMEDTISYGWPIFGFVAKILLTFLHGIVYVVRNYGLAIFILTILVRAAMYPLGRKQAQNAEMMKQLAPEIKAIQEKYKNLEERSKAQQDLYRKHNFNPLGGCWMMFIQMPIFFGLYKALSVSIDLRQASLIPGIRWCSNLAGPDMFLKWSTIFGEQMTGPDGMLGFLTAKTGYLGPYLNILPLFTIVLFIMHQKLFTPPATDDQQKLQQKMMSYMMIFMGFMFFKVPSGLCLYFITSSLWGIAERKLLPKPKLKKVDLAGKDGKAKGAKAGDSGEQKTMMQKAGDAAKENSFVSSLLEKIPKQPGHKNTSNGNPIDDATRRKHRKKKKKR